MQRGVRPANDARTIKIIGGARISDGMTYDHGSGLNHTILRMRILLGASLLW